MDGAEADAELERCRDLLREHFAQLTDLGRDPRVGVGWGPVVDRYDALVHKRATRAGLAGLPPQPWRTNGDRITADELCHAAGIVAGPPLLPRH